MSRARNRIARTLLAAALLACAGCRVASAPAPQRSTMRFNLQTLALPNLISVDWDFKFWFLDQSPPAMYNDYPISSTATGGEIVAVLPCLTNDSGTGRNQIQATALLHFAGQPDPVQGTGTAIFTCTRSQDVAVNLVISIQQTVNAGFGDANGHVVGVRCTSSLAWKGDGWLAVCSDASCGDGDAAFLFQNSCQDLDGSAPAYWACGTPTDWTLAGSVASSQFPVPLLDGTWSFGLSVLPSFTLPAPDLTLTDASGKLVVFSNVPTPVAKLVRASGVNSASLDDTRTAAFAADLVLPALTVGGATPHQLLELHNGSAGASASVWSPFGICDRVVQGTTSWAGLYVIDLRLHDAGSATLILSAQPAGLATQSARCTAVRAPDGSPQLGCTAASALP